MIRFIRFIKNRINTWDEICFDEKARFRTNTIIFTLVVSIFFVVMTTISILMKTMILTGISCILATVSVMLFVYQVNTDEYKPLVSYGFGLMSICMSVYLIYSGGFNGLGFLWIFLMPNISIMVVNLRASLVYNFILLSILILMLRTGFHDYLLCKYSEHFRDMFPFAILFVTFCVYLSELIRFKTSERLIYTSDKLKAYAFNDPLTGAYNRRAIKIHLGEDNSNSKDLSFGLLDLDFFKKINDKYGHDVGDETLKHLVELINDMIPEDSNLYRWGGEEFLIVFKKLDKKNTKSILEKICHYISVSPLETEDYIVDITVSIGGIFGSEDLTINECIKKSDELLYKAKTNGRNQVIFQGDSSKA